MSFSLTIFILVGFETVEVMLLNHMLLLLPLPPPSASASFTREVLWTLLRDVKFGEAVSYKQLADLAGNSKAARAVGGAMRSNPVSSCPLLK